MDDNVDAELNGTSGGWAKLVVPARDPTRNCCDQRSTAWSPWASLAGPVCASAVGTLRNPCRRFREDKARTRNRWRSTVRRRYTKTPRNHLRPVALAKSLRHFGLPTTHPKAVSISSADVRHHRGEPRMASNGGGSESGIFPRLSGRAIRPVQSMSSM